MPNGDSSSGTARYNNLLFEMVRDEIKSVKEEVAQVNSKVDNFVLKEFVEFRTEFQKMKDDLSHEIADNSKQNANIEKRLTVLEGQTPAAGNKKMFELFMALPGRYKVAVVLGGLVVLNGVAGGNLESIDGLVEFIKSLIGVPSGK